MWWPCYCHLYVVLLPRTFPAHHLWSYSMFQRGNPEVYSNPQSFLSLHCISNLFVKFTLCVEVCVVECGSCFTNFYLFDQGWKRSYKMWSKTCNRRRKSRCCSLQSGPAHHLNKLKPLLAPKLGSKPKLGLWLLSGCVMTIMTRISWTAFIIIHCIVLRCPGHVLRDWLNILPLIVHQAS